jgi:predicted  nucleic acid-binding Zn-ribbon protein
MKKTIENTPVRSTGINSEEELKKLETQIRANWKNVCELESQIATVHAECDALRKKIEDVQKQREQFNSRPDVIAAKTELQNAERKIKRLQAEVTRSQRLESLVQGQCDRLGISLIASPKVL